jgi:transcriptional regulator with XRE-family HTH domain
MVKRRRPELRAVAHLRNQEQAAVLGRQVRESRRRRRLTQQRLGELVDLSRSTVGAIERGLGASHTLETWQRIGIALDRPLAISFAPDAIEGPQDAGHLGMQELVLRLGRAAGYAGAFELTVRPSDSRRSIDVCLRDDGRRRLVIIECWNVIGDVGVAARSTSRKVAEAADLAIAIGGGRPHAVSACWVVRATRRNRELISRYPEVFAARFPGSSVDWVQALTAGAEPPKESGLVWCDVRATRVFAWRRPG